MLYSRYEQTQKLITIKMSECATCKKPIEGKVLTALEKKYHPEHFVCIKCKQPIKENNFRQHEGEPVCEADYAKFFLKKCAACKLPIKGKVIKAMDKDWHEDHFVCTSCKKSLAGQTFRERNGEPVCSACFQDKFADRCKGCTKPILDKAVVALNAKWHQDCFQCSKCKNPVVESTFHVLDGEPLCGKCS